MYSVKGGVRVYVYVCMQHCSYFKPLYLSKMSHMVLPTQMALLVSCACDGDVVTVCVCVCVCT